MERRALEKYKIFPVLAWILCIGFTLFVYNIVQDLKQSTSELQSSTNKLEKLLSQPPGEIKDFSR